VDYPVLVERVAPRHLAAAWGSSTAQIISLLNQVWPVLRGQRARTGHNVVFYFGDGRLAAGVEVLDGFAPTPSFSLWTPPPLNRTGLG
jgi:hypothetical protein